MSLHTEFNFHVNLHLLNCPKGGDKVLVWSECWHHVIPGGTRARTPHSLTCCLHCDYWQKKKKPKELYETSPCGKYNWSSLMCKAEMFGKLIMGLFWNFALSTHTKWCVYDNSGRGLGCQPPEKLLEKKEGWLGWPSHQGLKPRGEAGVPSQCGMGTSDLSGQ